MVRDIFSGLLSLVTVLTIAYLAVMIDHLEEGYNRSTDVLGFKVMVVPSTDAHESLEKITVWQRPLATAFTAENSKYFPCVITQANFPSDVAVSLDRMIGIETFTRPNRVGRIDKVAPWLE